MTRKAYSIMKAWSIDWSSGHCFHTCGISAYVDMTPTISGALRCMGPFGSKEISPKTILNLAETLSRQIEEEKKPACKYVVWGAYQEYPDYQPYEFQILDSSSGFIPSLSLRGLSTESSWKNQWTRTKGRVRHISGLVIYDSGRIDPPHDLAITHPSTLQIELSTTQRTLKRLGLTHCTRNDKFETEAMKLNSYIQTNLFNLAA